MEELKAAGPILQGMLRGVGATVAHSSRILIVEKCHPFCSHLQQLASRSCSSSMRFFLHYRPIYYRSKTNHPSSSTYPGYSSHCQPFRRCASGAGAKSRQAQHGLPATQRARLGDHRLQETTGAMHVAYPAPAFDLRQILRPSLQASTMAGKPRGIGREPNDTSKSIAPFRIP
jgi:hypothetical protein